MLIKFKYVRVLTRYNPFFIMKDYLMLLIMLFVAPQFVTAQELMPPKELKQQKCINKAIGNKVSTLKHDKVDTIIIVSRGYPHIHDTKYILWKKKGDCYRQEYQSCENQASGAINRLSLDSLLTFYKKVELLPRLKELMLHDPRGYEFDFYVNGVTRKYIIHDYQRNSLALKVPLKDTLALADIVDPRITWLKLVERIIKKQL